MTDPSVLVIDEPTSGLDAFTANHLMHTLKDLADTGRTVICSIHQPRSDIFGLFDHILLLTRGGRPAFSGPARWLVPYLSQQGFKLPELTNPADFALDISSVDLRNALAEETTSAQVSKLVDTWKTKGLDLAEVENGQTIGIAAEPRSLTPFSVAFPVLVSRSYLNAKRQPNIVIARIMQVVFLGLVIALFFAPQGHTQVTVQNRIGVIVSCWIMLATIAFYSFYWSVELYCSISI